MTKKKPVLPCFCASVAISNLRKQILPVIFLVLWQTISFAQTPRSYTSSEILLQLKKLNVLGSVLYIAAHPDDENTRLLAYLANEKLYRTGYLSLTRGDGGQNLIGDEQGVDLGLIRTQELLSARRIDGAEQFFSRAFDFGFSKSPEEAMRIWGHDKILSDVVWVIRKFKPDVIITRFPTTGEGGHGHHTASAILAGEAELRDGIAERLVNRLDSMPENILKPDEQRELQPPPARLLHDVREVHAHSRFLKWAGDDVTSIVDVEVARAPAVNVVEGAGVLDGPGGRTISGGFAHFLRFNWRAL